jgi:hypothetical protein
MMPDKNNRLSDSYDETDNFPGIFHIDLIIPTIFRPPTPFLKKPFSPG